MTNPIAPLRCDVCGREPSVQREGEACWGSGCPGHFRPAIHATNVHPLCQTCNSEYGSCVHTASKVEREAFVPEPGECWQGKSGRIASWSRLQGHNPENEHGWRDTANGALVGNFVPQTKLIPESQLRGSVVTEADIKEAMVDLWEPWPDGENGYQFLLGVLRKHFLNKSTPSVAAGTVKGEGGTETPHRQSLRSGEASREELAATAGATPQRNAVVGSPQNADVMLNAVSQPRFGSPSPSTDDFDIRVEMVLTALRARGWVASALTVVEQAINEFLRPMVGNNERRQQVDELAGTIAELRNRIGGLESQRDAALSAKQERDRQVDSLQQQLDALQLTVDDMRNEIDGLASDSARMSKEIP